MFIWPAFHSDSRANRLKAYEVGTSVNAVHPAQWVDLCGPEEVATQLELVFASSAKRVEVPSDRRAQWSHRFDFDQGLPAPLVPMLEFLKKYLSLAKMPHLDVGIAFDWYKVPEDGVESSKWKNSKPGELVHRSKYWRVPFAQSQALKKLIDGTVAVIAEHPLLTASPTVLTVPGSAGDGKSVGERYAAGVASKTGKNLVRTTCTTTGARKQAKESGSAHLEGTFLIDSPLSGSVIIIDDVCRTGGTFRATALAARQAGATHVFGLAAVRTLRN
ncbi:phosphoribosyltransferase [Micromonospora sp. ZYX-F-536]|uniref:phosphoribosyltransferase n=1 Tax=Micromonospora sp. ZYX-F-536 TaxID=3457629 RepID=UPI0040408DD5